MQRIASNGVVALSLAARPRRVRSVIEERSPVEALTVYRALVVCHMAGAVFVLMGSALNAGAIDERFRTVTVVAAVVQFAVATWLLRNPEWLPRILLGMPRATWIVSLAIAVLYMVPATDPSRRRRSPSRSRGSRRPPPSVHRVHGPSSAWPRAR